jgi:perosamine synthetase
MNDVIPLFKVHMPESVKEPLLEVLFSGFIGQGPVVDRFESQLDKFFEFKNSLTVNSGTSALHLALRLANVKHGDEVICTPMTCTASNMPVLAMGATIRWADIDPVTGLIDINSIESNITEKTKAIIMVHFGGIPCQIEEINRLAASRGIKTIEDGAHAFGTNYKDRKIGSLSDFTMFSLQAIKHITTIDGGILICKSDEDFKRGKLLRWYGIDRESPRKDFRCEENISEYGYKFHMNDVSAIIGIEQLKYIDSIISKHRSNALKYRNQLSNLEKVKLIPIPRDVDPSYWLFTIHVTDRDKFMEYMLENGVSCSKVHERNDIHDAFNESACYLPGVDKFCKTQVSIPVGWWLSEGDTDKIISLIKKF